MAPLPAAGERVANYLREAILRGDIRPGERIRQEEVAERFGASRIPVREALRILEAEGLTEHLPNRGARVPFLGAREVDLLYKMRERLEPLALVESLPRLTASHLHQLTDLQARIAAGPDVAEFMTLDREFHLLTYSQCDMEPLLAIVSRLWNSTHYYRRIFMNLLGPGSRWVVNAEHDLLLDALKRGDEAGAARTLKGHVRRTRIELSHHPEVFQANPERRT